MAYNFKSIADVEVVAEPAESANVLIEENGVIKKAPKTAVGGAGGAEPDMVITVSGQSSYALEDGNFAITEGSINKVFAAFRDGRYPIIKVRFYANDNTAYTAIREEYNAYVCTYGENLWFSFIALNPYEDTCLYVHKIYMNGDGTISQDNLRRATLAAV